jgi:hypothetical protein
VLKKIFEPSRQEVMGGWRTLHNERYNLRASAKIIREIKENEVRSCSTHWKDVKRIQNSNRKSEGKRPLGRPRCEGNIRMDLRAVE